MRISEGTVRVVTAHTGAVSTKSVDLLAPLLTKEGPGEIPARSKTPPRSPLSKGGRKIADILARGIRSRLRLFALLALPALLAAMGTPVSAQQQMPVPEVAELKRKPIDDAELHLPVDDRTAVEIDRFIGDLGSPDYATREAATEALLSIGATAFAKLRDAYRGTDDFERRVRIEGIVKTGYLTHHVFSKTGFLGMQQDRQLPVPSHDTDPRIPENTLGIRIGRIVENTGAERAGLKKGDIIIELDGEPLEGVGLELFGSFSAKIRKTGPGGQLNLTILRPDDGVFEVTATLGPVNRSSFNNVTGMREIIPVVDKRFFIWWERYFKTPKVAASSNK